MTIHIPRMILPAIVLLAFTALTAHAQDCLFYCTAYGSYDVATNTLYGYVEYSDGGEGFELGVDATIENPDGESVGGCDSPDDFDYVMASCSYAPGSNGIWSVYGYPWYDTEEETPDGTAEGDIGVLFMPSGEEVSGHSIISGGAIFYLTLLPDFGFSYDGYYVSENLSGFSETCYDEDPGGPSLTQPTPAGGGLVTGNQYQDTVASAYSYLYYYESRVADGIIAPCGWSLSQGMSYNAVQYLTQSMGQNITITGAYTYRGATSYLNF